MPMPPASVLSISITLKDQKELTDPIQLRKLRAQTICNTIGALGRLLSLASTEKIISAGVEGAADDLFIEENDGCFFAVGQLISCFADQVFDDVEQLAEAVST